MNRLSFREFHAKHFGPEQVQQWRAYIESQYQGYTVDEQGEQDTNDVQNGHDEPLEHDEEPDARPFLPQEWIEIFAHSEQFEKERQDEEKQQQGEEDEDDGDDEVYSRWPAFLATRLAHDGIEAPAHTLIQLPTREKTIDPNTQYLEHRLNAAYMGNCRQTKEELALWPVLPFRL
ncbi:hypothetical protein BC940DRAFT_299419 [Gongronella butleri]|nr:hypothetical protein BC940DRAFT_299419 [Gongronella butleri]